MLSLLMTSLRRTVAALFLGLAASAARAADSAAPPPERILLLWNPQVSGSQAIDQESFRATLTGLGLSFEVVVASRASVFPWNPRALAIVPAASAGGMDAAAVRRLLAAVAEGMTLVTDGASPVSEGMGIGLSTATAPMLELFDSIRSKPRIRWQGRQESAWIVQPSSSAAATCYADAAGGRRLVIEAPFGRGRYLFFASLYDPVSGYGYSRFPDLPLLLLEDFGVQPPVKRLNGEAYFEPGDRPGDVSLEALAQQWADHGIRLVHAATWHYFNDTPSDYRALIDAAHRHGILVYAWFEWPHVGPRFWREHPACHERTATLEEAHVFWRDLVSLEDPTCWDAAMEAARPLLERFDWDGITVGELYLESPWGPERPGMFTPFSAWARDDFRKQAGFDPVELFEPLSPRYRERNAAGMALFAGYRKRLVLGLFEKTIRHLQALRRRLRRDWEIVAVIIDTEKDLVMADSIGVDLPAHLRLIRRFGITPQIEDDGFKWSDAPTRYADMGRRYRAALQDQPFAIDINIVAPGLSRPPEYCALSPAGSETLQLLRIASGETDRVSLYAESTIPSEDWKLVAYGLAGRARAEEGPEFRVIVSSNTVSARIPWETPYTVDGQPWPCGDRAWALLPAGRHVLRPDPQGQEPSPVRLLSISGELFGCRPIPGGMELQYESPGRCAIRFSPAEAEVRQDGKALRIDRRLRSGEIQAIVSPPGRHRLQITRRKAGRLSPE
jgi:hypothetical protein